MKRHTQSVILSSLILSPFYSSHSQNIFDLSLNELKDIKVEVASLFEDSRIDVASSTAVINREQWQTRMQYSQGSVLESVPSVYYGTTWGGSEVLAIRGYATELSVRGIAYSLDGIPLGTYVYANTGYILAKPGLGLMDKIEMIRGPGSTLYGNDAFHGVMSYRLMESPTDYSEAYIQTGSPEHLSTSFVQSSKLNDWQLHAGLSYENDANNDLSFSYTDPENGATYDSERNQAYENLSAYLKTKNGSLTSEYGKFQITLFHNQYEAEEFQGIGQQFFTAIPNVFDVDSTSLAKQGDTTGSNSEFNLLALQHEKILSDSKLQFKNHLYKWQSEQIWDYDNRYYPSSLTTLGNTTLPCKGNQNDSNPNPIYCSHILLQSTDERRAGYLVQLKHPKIGDNTQWVVGAGYEEISVIDSDFERVSALESNLGEIIHNPGNTYEGKTRTMSHMLAQARSEFFNNQLLVTYGARYDYYSDVNDHFSPRLGLVHILSNNWRQKILYGHAYRAPTAVEQFGTGPIVSNEELNPETIDTIEYVLIHNTENLEVESVLYFSQWKDAITLEETGTNNQNIYRNIAENESKGWELAVRGQNESLYYQGFVSYNESRALTEMQNYEAFPTWMLQLNLEYALPKYKTKLGLWQRQMWDYNLNDDSSVPSSTSNYARTDLYGQLSLSRNTQLGLSINNLLDEKNRLTSFYGSEGGLLDYGRSVKANLRHQF